MILLFFRQKIAMLLTIKTSIQMQYLLCYMTIFTILYLAHLLLRYFDNQWLRFTHTIQQLGTIGS